MTSLASSFTLTFLQGLSLANGVLHHKTQFRDPQRHFRADHMRNVYNFSVISFIAVQYPTRVKGALFVRYTDRRYWEGAGRSRVLDSGLTIV